MLGAPGEVEAALAGVDQGVAQGGKVQGTHVGMGGGLGLLAVVGWRGQGKQVRETAQVGTGRVKSDTVTSTGDRNFLEEFQLPGLSLGFSQLEELMRSFPCWVSLPG